MAYPTPPPTSSPKDDLKHEYTNVHNYRSYDDPIQRRPAQETYFHAQSEPNSPRQQSVTIYRPDGPEQRLHHSNTDSPKHFYGPPNQRPADHIYNASPSGRPNGKVDTRPTKPGNDSSPLYYNHSARPSSAQKRRTPPPRPLYFSPTNRPPSPYSTARPQPRPGLIQRMKNKLTQWIRGFMRWAKKNPIKAGLATFVPILLGAGAIRAVSGLSGVAKHMFGKLETGMGGGKPGKKRKPVEEKEWEWGLNHFVGFGGTKGGPLDGIMKVLQMFMNHYARLTPSAVPRAACILLELYFLEKH